LSACAARLRIERAAHLLKTSRATDEQIAVEVGYTNSACSGNDTFPSTMNLAGVFTG
jgi:transcriptional regulator GlxA family with amidase domain